MYENERGGISDELTLQSTGMGERVGLSQNFKSWTFVTVNPKKCLKKKLLVEAKFVWLNQFFLFTEGNSKTLKLAILKLQFLTLAGHNYNCKLTPTNRNRFLLKILEIHFFVLNSPMIRNHFFVQNLKIHFSTC